MNLKKLVQAIFTLYSLKKLNWNYGSTVLSYFFLNLEGESDENENSDFEILLHFEAAIVAE